MKLKWPILPLLPEISETSLFAGVVHLYVIISFLYIDPFLLPLNAQ